ncbi:AAEL011367-PA [Aedes aegypti]|uniref:GDP-D-glucose phosphorylase 1 n=1 Tax=Aedes aegypti TaxID=7159 RepID=Q16Q87_AEDAE|nr:AAEL011367-PA [Aedes aegypti]
MSIESIQPLEEIAALQQTIETRWQKLHDENPDGVFRYQLAIERERVTTRRCRFLLQLNRKRTTARRKPDGISSMVPAFDPTLFNFNKVDSREVLLEVKSGNCSVAIMINNSPLTKFHFLIVPDRSQNMAQILTQDSLEAVFKIFLLMGDHRYRMGFNSPGALASVNHLHYHFMLMCHKLYVEDAPLTALGEDLYLLENQPARAYCFLHKSGEPPAQLTNRIFRLIRILLSQNIAHNLFITWNGSRDTVRALIYTRLKPCENKQVSPFNVAFSELSGFVPLGDESDYERLDEIRLEEYFREAQGTLDEDAYRKLDQTVLDGLADPNGR